MSSGEKSPPESLASLRGRMARERRPARHDSPATNATRPQMGLLFAESASLPEHLPAPDLLPAEALTIEVSHETTRAFTPNPDLLPSPAPPALPVSPPPRGHIPLSTTQAPSANNPALTNSPNAARPSPRSAEPAVWGVRALVGRLRERVEDTFREVLVEGEISTCRPASSGHLYMTLKEADTQLSVVLFRRQAQLLRFRPQQGMAVLARGRLSVYEGRGELQLIAESLEPRGTGALLLAFERLKERLGREGLFSQERKRPLPAYPHCIGVVTSTAGAVLHDIITVVRRRHARLNLLIYPAAVQGPSCASTMAAGLRWFNAHPSSVDLILLARGGGSPEDLCGFNDEGLAREIARSALPVVSAVGHETDFTIADFVADLRAPTPSAAAEIITASQHRVEERLLAAQRSIHRSLRLRMLEARERFARASATGLRARVEAALNRRGQRIDDLHRRLHRVITDRLARHRRAVARLEATLQSQQVAARLQRDRGRLERLAQWLDYWGPMAVERRRAALERASGRLRAMSPLAVLDRGYALVYAVHEGTVTSDPNPPSPTRKLLRSSQDAAPGQRLVARLAQGEVEATVLAAHPQQTAQSERDDNA